MKRLLLLGMCILLPFNSLSHAAPAAPDTYDIVQPDGTSFKARSNGDEFQNWTEATGSGHTIVKNHGNDYWEYAGQNADGALMPSGQRVDPTGRMAPRSIRKGIRPPRDTGMENLQQEGLKGIFQERLAPLSSTGIDQSQAALLPDGVAAAAGSGWVPQPVSGTRKILIVLVSFTDRAIQTTAASWSNVVFSTTPGVKSVANYYSQHSFGKVIISPLAHTQPGYPTGVVSVTLPQNHPNPPQSNLIQGESTWVPAAINAVDQYVNFKNLDANNNGFIDRSELIVYFILAGYEQATGTAHTPAVWAHATNYGSGGLSAAQVKFPVYAMNGELNDPGRQMPVGVMVHELGHQICGLPDLYDTSQTNQGLGNFSVMAAGNWGRTVSEVDSGTTPVGQDAWSREYVGWSSPQTPINNLALNLGTPLALAGNSLKLVNSSVSTTEYWLADNRFPTSNTWDEGIAGLITGYGGGMLITHVDLTIGTPGTGGSTGSNDFNKYGVGAHQGLVIEQASTSGCDMVASGSKCRGSTLTTFYNGNNASFALATTPNSNYYSGTASGFQVNSISARGATMTASVVTPTNTVTPPTVTNFILNSGNPASSLIVSITTLTASGTGVNGYWVSESNAVPAAGAAGWTSSPPPSYTFTTAGSKTLYAFARDSAGNVSSARSASVTITLPDTTPPTVLSFNLQPTSSSAIVTITAFTASDNVAVTGYCVSETNSSAGCTWIVSAPGNFTVSGIIPGTATTKTLYAFARDAAGNLSASRSATVTITIADSIAPTVTVFTLPSSSNSAAVNITGFTATDNVGVTGYCVTEGSSSACSWSGTPQAGYTFSGIAAGVPTARTLNAFARDAAGNVSSGLAATVTITIPLAAGGVNIILNPGFEAGIAGWTSYSSGNYVIISNGSGLGNNGTNWYGWLGGANNLTENIYQDIAIPANATAANFSFYYKIYTAETSTTQALDTMKVEIVDPATGTTILLALRTFSNLDATAGWTRSQDFDLLQFKGRTVRVRFSDATDAANLTGFQIDDVSLLVTIAGVDSIPPQISAFSIPSTYTALTVPVTFNVSDNVGVTGYCLIENSSSAGCSWNGTKPVNYTFGTLAAGIPAVKTLYAFAKDAAGNVSVGWSSTVTITLPPAGGATNMILNPGFESGPTSWVSYSSAGYDPVYNGAGLGNNGSDWYAWLGGDISLTENFYQDVTIPATATAANLNFYYSIGTDETLNGIYDTMTVEVADPVTGASKAVLQTFSNLDATSGWVRSQTFNLLSYKGTTVRIRFSDVNDSSRITSFFVDDVNLDVITSGGDGIPPQISSFSLSPASSSLTVPITSFIVTDNVGVTGYCLNESGDESLCVWQPAVPQSYTFGTITQGIPTVKTLYVFARDAAGNISAVRSATVAINIPDSLGRTNIIQNPGFEDGDTVWTSYSSGGWSLIWNDSGSGNNGSDWFGWLGGDDTLSEFIYQDVVIPANATGAVFNFSYEIITDEINDPNDPNNYGPFDVMTVSVVDPDTGVTLQSLRTFSNLDTGTGRSTGWIRNLTFDLSAYIGKKVRIMFADTTDISNSTSFYIDDVRLLVTLPPAKQPLSVAINGTGAGSVNSNPAGIACSTGAVGLCSAQFDSGSQTTLYPTPSAGSFFSGWTNACTNLSGTCKVTMSAARGVTGTFNYYPARTVNGQALYSSLQAAYNGTATNDTILVQGATLPETLLINRAITVTLKGGYDTLFSSASGNTLIQGTFTLRNGTIILDGFTIR